MELYIILNKKTATQITEKRFYLFKETTTYDLFKFSVVRRKNSININTIINYNKLYFRCTLS